MWQLTLSWVTFFLLNINDHINVDFYYKQMVRQQKNETFPRLFISKFNNQLMNPDAESLNL